MRKLLLAALLLIPSSALADFQCDDKAKMFSNKQKEACHDRLQKDEYWSTYDLRIETYDDGRPDDEFQELFEQRWKKLKHSGVFVMIDKKSRAILIRGSRKNSMEEALIPAMYKVFKAFFRDEDYDGGLRAITLLFQYR